MHMNNETHIRQRRTAAEQRLRARRAAHDSDRQAPQLQAGRHVRPRDPVRLHTQGLHVR